MLFCNTPEKNLGSIKEGEPTIIEYEILNKDAIPYKLQPWSNCGCSTPILPKEIIEPGETMKMIVNFDSVGKVGINEKSCGVFYEHNGPKGKLTVKFFAEVVK